MLSWQPSATGFDWMLTMAAALMLCLAGLLRMPTGDAVDVDTGLLL